jgi:hypothetical protein
VDLETNYPVLLPALPASCSSSVAKVLLALQNQPAKSLKFNLGVKRQDLHKVPVFQAGTSLLIPSDEIIVQFKEPENQTANEHLLARFSSIRRQESQPGQYTIRTGDPEHLLKVAREIGGNLTVQYAEPNFMILIPAGPAPDPPFDVSPSVPPRSSAPEVGKPDFDRQWGLSKIGYPYMWQRFLGNRVKIAILDEVVAKHPNLPPFKFIDLIGESAPADQDEHGTAVAGIVMALGNNGANAMAGIAPNAQGIAIRMMTRSPAVEGYIITAPRCMEEAITQASEEQADVISGSWGYGSCPNSLDYWPNIRHAIDAAIKRNPNVVMVFASGYAPGPSSFPACLASSQQYPQIIAVGASNKQECVKTQESRDPDDAWASPLDASIYAPGIEIYTTTQRNGYTQDFHGTSASTPFVSGVAALVIQNLNDRSIPRKLGDVKDILKTTGDKIRGPGPNFVVPRVNACRALFEFESGANVCGSPPPVQTPEECYKQRTSIATTRRP